MSTWGRTGYSMVIDWYSPRSLVLTPKPQQRTKAAVAAAGESLETSKKAGQWCATGSVDTGAALVGGSGSRFEPSVSQSRAMGVIRLEPVDSAAQERSSDQELEMSVPGARALANNSVALSPSAKVSPLTKELDNVSLHPADTATTVAAFSGSLAEGDEMLASRDLRAHHRFSSGGVLPKPFIAAMYTMACKFNTLAAFNLRAHLMVLVCASGGCLFFCLNGSVSRLYSRRA